MARTTSKPYHVLKANGFLTVLPYHGTRYHTTPCHTKLCCTTLNYYMLYYTMLRFTVICFTDTTDRTRQTRPTHARPTCIASHRITSVPHPTPPYPTPPHGPYYTIPHHSISFHSIVMTATVTVTVTVTTPHHTTAQQAQGLHRQLRAPGPRASRLASITVLCGKRDSIHHHLLEGTFETATVLELREKPLYSAPSGWWWCIDSVFRL